MVRKDTFKTKRRPPPRWLVWLRLIVAVVIVGGALLGYRACFWQAGPPSDSPYVSLVKVIDGDTIRVQAWRGEELKVRLIGIDAPELGTAASFRAALSCAELLEGADAIRLEPEPTGPKDKYGRTLGWIWLEQAGGGEQLLQEELIRAGLVEIYRDAAGSKHYARLELAARHRE